MNNPGRIISVLLYFIFLSLLTGCPAPSEGETETAPAAPAAPVLTVGDGELSVSWSAVSGATAYEVWYSDTNDSSAASRFGGDITGTSTIITGLINGTTYYVWILAKNSAGSSSFSDEESCEPHGAGDTKSYQMDNLDEVIIYCPGGTDFPIEGDDSETASVNAFWIGQKEVAYENWYTVLNWAQNGTGGDTGEGIYTFGNQGRAGHDGTDGLNPLPDGYMEPVSNFNWRDAMVFCNALTEYCNSEHGTSFTCVYTEDSNYETPIRTSTTSTTIDLTAGSEDAPFVNSVATGFRLPTVYEWECAARYQDGVDWTPGDYASGASGDSSTETDAVAWYSANSDTGSGNDTYNCGTKAANGLGCYDMSGNVAEWCFEWYPSVSDPDTYRYYRGGNFISSATYIVVGTLNYAQRPYYKNSGIGLRVCRSAE